MSELAPLPIGAASGVIYFGTPQIAVGPLQALVDGGIKVELVVTRPDARRGRGSEVTPSAVKSAALKLGLTVADNLQDVDAVLTQGAATAMGQNRLGVVVAYGRLLPVSFLERLPMVNLHYSLLPKWRGAAPVERAILAGDAVTGVCIMRVVEGLDEGEIYRSAEVRINEQENATVLRERISQVAIPLMLDVVTNGAGKASPQVGEPIYAAKIVSADLLLDWERSAEHLARITRVGVAHTIFRGKRMNLRSAHSCPGPVQQSANSSVAGEPCGSIIDVTEDGVVVATGTDPKTGLSGALCATILQPEGKPSIAAKDWARGARLRPGERFGS